MDFAFNWFTISIWSGPIGVDRHIYNVLLRTRGVYIQVCLFGSLEKEIIFMTSLLTLPVHLVYRILDQLKPVEIFISVRNVCTRLNLVTDSYHPYKVSSGSLSSCSVEFLLTSSYPSFQQNRVASLFELLLSEWWILRDDIFDYGDCLLNNE